MSSKTAFQFLDLPKNWALDRRIANWAVFQYKLLDHAITFKPK